MQFSSWCNKLMLLAIVALTVNAVVGLAEPERLAKNSIDASQPAEYRDFDLSANSLVAHNKEFEIPVAAEKSTCPPEEAIAQTAEQNCVLSDEYLNSIGWGPDSILDTDCWFALDKLHRDYGLSNEQIVNLDYSCLTTLVATASDKRGHNWVAAEHERLTRARHAIAVEAKAKAANSSKQSFDREHGIVRPEDDLKKYKIAELNDMM